MNIATHIQSAVILMQWRIATGTLGAVMLTIGIMGFVALVRSMLRDMRRMPAC